MAAQQPSPLLQLPPELRNRIYHYVFEDITVDIVAKPSDSTFKRRKYQTKTPGVLLSCRQIHNEAMEMYYASVTFQAQNAVPLTSCIKNTPAVHRYATLIKTLRVDSSANLKQNPPQLYHDKLFRFLYAQEMVGIVRRHLSGCGSRMWLSGRLEVSVELEDGRVIWTSTPEQDCHVSGEKQIGAVYGNS